MSLAPATVDIESFSRVDLKKAGLYKYAEDESTDLLCVCWSFPDGPVEAWVPSADEAFADELQTGCAGLFEKIHVGPTSPSALLEALKNFTAWNAAFERNVLNGPAGKRYGIPHIEIEQTRCSMARSRHASMPGKLEDAARVLNTPVQKRTAGINAMRYLCKPRKDGTRPTIAEERGRFLALVPYCADDVRAEQGVDAILPEMSPKELRVYQLDQRINDRGVRVDLDAVSNFEALIHEYKSFLKSECVARTGVGPSQLGNLSAWIRANGYPALENLQADTVRRLLVRSDVPDNIKTVLRVYSTYNLKAVAKYPAMRLAACKDGRIRGMLQYHAAGTGRWSSFIVQIHNLFRPVIEDPELAVEAAKTRDLDWIRALYPGVDPMKVFASCVRSCLVADDGKELVFPDFSGVESRWTAWIFGEEWKLEAFRQDRDTYVESYRRSFNVPVTQGVTPRQRLLGKVLELSMQYQGGVGAFIKMAANYRLDLSEIVGSYAGLPADIKLEAQENYASAELHGRLYGLTEEVWLAAEGLKIAWRRAHPKIVAGWRQLEDAAANAVANPGQIYAVAGKKLQFKVEGQWLIMRLPSGRKTRYFQPRLEDSDSKVTYEGVDTATRMWGKTSTYGGKLCENQAQGGCRDLLVDAMLSFDRDGHKLVMHVHDEPVIEAAPGEVPDAYIDLTMCTPPAWAAGFPLAVEGHRGRRYRK